MPLLEIRNLAVEFTTARGVFRAVDGLDLTLDDGAIVGIVGESGSGKSVAMLAVMGLIAWPGRVRADRLHFAGHDLLHMTSHQRRRLIGKDMAMVFQEPTSSLNPCYPVGWQIAESLRAHHTVDRRAVRGQVIDLLHQVGIPAPETRLGAFPHQLSGGMNQRVMIAMAIACNPLLLIADEPTTALDVTIQKQILDLLISLQRERGMALVLITHDMAVVAETAHRVMVMYAGQMVEEAQTAHLFAAPRHPYTAALLGRVAGARARPAADAHDPRRCARHRRSADRLRVPPALRLRGAALLGSATWNHAGPDRTRALLLSVGGACVVPPLMEARDLRRYYLADTGLFARKGTVRAVDGVSFTLNAGQTLAVVGESGCGKSTLARMATLLEPPTAGDLLIDGEPTERANAAERRKLLMSVQMVFQNPYGSLNPRKTVGAILEEPLAINHRGDRQARPEAARAMMAKVGLRQDQYGRYPHMFSGGQRQRIAIARALMLRPRIVVADEPVSALDVSIQAQVLNLLMDLQDEFHLAYLFISHDLSVVRHIAHDVLVMYLRPGGGAWPEAERVRGASASVYTHAAGGDPVARSGASEGGGDGEGRAAFADRSACRLRVRLALSACDGTVCGGAAGAAAARRGAGRLPPRRGDRLSAISPRQSRVECAPAACRAPR